VILTGSELRHEFFRKTLAASPRINILNSYCETHENNLRSQVESSQENHHLRLRHLNARAESETLYFQESVNSGIDNSKPIALNHGAINSDRSVASIIDLNPDLLFAYGCSIIREPLLSTFSGRFVNVHLGLSPYYRGSGTNYWPLVNGAPEYVGATFMHIDQGIDTGEIIHQVRATAMPGDTPSNLGNRLIQKMTLVAEQLITSFDTIVPMTQPPEPPDARRYRSKDFSESSVAELYENFENGLVDRYLDEQVERCARVPILSNPALESESP